MLKNDNREKSQKTDFAERKTIEFATTDSLSEMVEFVTKNFPMRDSSEEFRLAVEKKAIGNDENINLDELEQHVEELKTKIKCISYIGKINFYNWWNGKTGISRDSAIKIIFALEMDIIEATRFLTVSCGHNGFYMRDYRDVIFVFCIENKLDYTYAEKIIAKHSALDRLNPDAKEPPTGESITIFIKETLKQIKTEEELDDYLTNNKEYFGHFRISAYKLFMEMYSILKEDINNYDADKDKYLKGTSDNTITDEEICKLILMKIPSSTDVKHITNKTLRKIADRTLRREELDRTKNKTPHKKTIPQINRQYLISLWLLTDGEPNDNGSTDNMVNLEAITRNLHDFLDFCGMPRLDVRNPFDWLIFYALVYRYLNRNADEEASERIEKVVEKLFQEGRI